MRTTRLNDKLKHLKKQRRLFSPEVIKKMASLLPAREMLSEEDKIEKLIRE